jgi:hypothetical protein
MFCAPLLGKKLMMIDILIVISRWYLAVIILGDISVMVKEMDFMS